MCWYGADLHIHTGLSPCASDDMSPLRIVRAAAERGISIVAICDHNSAENIRAVMKAAEGSSVSVLAGMEVQTKEEVHVVCLFDSAGQAEGLQRTVYDVLPDLPYAPGLFGRQVLFGVDDSIIGECRKPLYAAAGITLSDLAREVDRLGGIMIAAHFDRPAFSVLGTLGLIPRDVPFAALETTKHGGPRLLSGGVRLLTKDYAIVWSSDAHSLGQVGAAMTAFYVKGATVSELRMAFSGEGLRRVVVLE